MSCFDCKKMHSKCKAACCGVVPIPKTLYDESQDKIVREPKEIMICDDSVIPITASGNCVFLNEDLSCNIYENRPIICEKFGDESHPMLVCPFLDKEGNERTRQDRRRQEKKCKKHIDELCTTLVNQQRD